MKVVPNLYRPKLIAGAKHAISSDVKGHLDKRTNEFAPEYHKTLKVVHRMVYAIQAKCLLPCGHSVIFVE